MAPAEDEPTPLRARQRHVVDVDGAGDLVLDVTFETSRAVLAQSRKPADGPPKPRSRVAYRVSMAALKSTSRYFAQLFSNPQFSEAKLIAETHKHLAARGLEPSEAAAQDLPFVALVDGDEATQATGRELVVEDMLLILHRKPIKTPKVVMSYAVTLAIVADRFDCVDAVARALNGQYRFKWPTTNGKPLVVDDPPRRTDVEQVMRQKVLVSWLLGQPLRLQQATRELIIRGSSLWGVYEADANTTAAWWNLPQGLEGELRHRRECIINAIASVQRHFIAMYTSRDRQCKLGYDSSAACDSFQLGQMLKFLASKELLYLVDFSPLSLDSLPDIFHADLEELVSTLKQFPSYQVDRHHTNCGPYIRIKPIMDYLCTMLSSSTISISHADWMRRRADVSWVRSKPSKGTGDDEGRVFAFTRAIASDRRLFHERTLHADRMATDLFTAESWDWTPEA